MTERTLAVATNDLLNVFHDEKPRTRGTGSEEPAISLFRNAAVCLTIDRRTTTRAVVAKFSWFTVNIPTELHRREKNLARGSKYVLSLYRRY